MFGKKTKDVTHEMKLYEALSLIMNECSMHGSCNEDCPLFDEEWKCIRNIQPFVWGQFAKKQMENLRKEYPNDRLISFDCADCVDEGDCKNKDALSYCGLRIEDIGCRDYRSKK